MVQVLEHVPASVKIVRHVEKRMICRDGDTTVAGEMPTLPIERGKPGPGLLAHIMIAKFDDHIPLYRLSEMYERLGIDISRSVMADWVGRASSLLAPLVSATRAHSASLHSNENNPPSNAGTKHPELFRSANRNRQLGNPRKPFCGLDNASQIRRCLSSLPTAEKQNVKVAR